MTYLTYHPEDEWSPWHYSCKDVQKFGSTDTACMQQVKAELYQKTGIVSFGDFVSWPPGFTPGPWITTDPGMQTAAWAFAGAILLLALFTRLKRE